MSWVSEELRDVDLGDERRNRRLIQIVEDLAAQPTASVPQAMRDAAAVQGVYEFWANRRVQPEEIVAAHARRTVERMALSALPFQPIHSCRDDYGMEPKILDSSRSVAVIFRMSFCDRFFRAGLVDDILPMSLSFNNTTLISRGSGTLLRDF